LNVVPTRLPGLVLIEPRVLGDSRGWFYEAYHAERYREAGVRETFVQDNVSMSGEGVLRGVHLQNPKPQGKLVQVLAGRVWDVAVDLRTGSPHFGQWEGYELSVENHRQFYIPPGFGHGFVVLEGPAILSYKCTDHYHAAGDMAVKWDDPEIGIEWPRKEGLIISEKDHNGMALRDVPPGRLVPYGASQRP
jgi:dTDP-4-dehydrorhamnose 3,5-epimerase